MALEDYIRETRTLIMGLRSQGKGLLAQADTLEKGLNELLRVSPKIPAGVLKDGLLIRKPTTWKTADDIERILEFGAKPMKREQLIEILVGGKLVGGDDADDAQRYQYGNEAIRRGLQYGYLKEDGDTTVHWVPSVRKSRVRKKL